METKYRKAFLFASGKKALFYKKNLMKKEL
jgi:hypothetical protein